MLRPRHHLANGVLLGFRENLDVAVGSVAYPPTNAEASRFSLRRGAEKNTCDSATNDQQNPFRCHFIYTFR
jgi:hypothetical protein